MSVQLTSSTRPADRLSRDTAKFAIHLTGAASPGPVDSRTLLRGTREVLIRHGGETYRLRHTRNDKLILTK